MDTASFNFIADEYIRAAPDSGLSSSESHLLKTLLSEEDQSQYNEIINTTLSHHTLHILHQVTLPRFFCIYNIVSLRFSVVFTSSSLSFHHMDIDHLTQKTPPLTT